MSWKKHNNSWKGWAYYIMYLFSVLLGEIYCLGLDQTKIPLIQETQINKKKQGDCAVLNDLVCELLPLNLNSPAY